MKNLTIFFAAVILVMRGCSGWFFDSIISYRQGNNSINTDTATFPYENEPDVPDSVDEVFAYTSSNADDSIDIVHCYSMRNGLHGSPEEARIFWSQIDFSKPDYHRQGHAENTKVVSFPIETKIEHFAVYETDLTVFLLSQQRDLQINLHIVPGPSIKKTNKPLRTFTFKPEVAQTTMFSIDQLLILPEAKKVIFYSQDYFGEISLENYPFDSDYDDINPSIKIVKVHEQSSKDQEEQDSNYDFSSASSLLQIQPVYFLLSIRLIFLLKRVLTRCMGRSALSTNDSCWQGTNDSQNRRDISFVATRLSREYREDQHRCLSCVQ